MWLYSSLPIMAGVTVLTLMALLWLATRQNPVAVAADAFRTLRHDQRTLPLLLGLAGVLAINSLETRLEGLTGIRVTWDFTADIAQVGTGFLLGLQRLEWAPATHTLTFVYIFLFQVLGIGSGLVYAAYKDWDSVKRLFYGFFINYLVALPFYLLVPVKEAWAGGVGVKFLIPEVYPLFESQYRLMSGLDNCLPSLHTSLALTYALVALRSGHRRLARIIGVGAGLVIFSTLYLGVHWPLDMVAGVCLAIVASGLVPLPSFLTGRNASPYPASQG